MKNLSLRMTAIAIACAFSVSCGAGATGSPLGGADGGLGTGGQTAGAGGAAGEGNPGSGGQVSGTGGGVGSGGAGGTGGGISSGSGGSVGQGSGGMTLGGSSGTGSGGAGGRVGGGSGGQIGSTAGRSGTLRIMPLGDSTTGSVCWRALLWQKLNQGGFTGRFDFVGSRTNDAGCGVAGYDQDNEGHPSVLVTDFVTDADNLVAGIQTPQALLGAHPADVVLFHFATNDVWNSRTPASILAAYSTVLGALRLANPNVVVLVAQVIPMAVTAMTCAGCSCPTCPAGIMTLNDMLVGWASSNSTAASPIGVVDQWTGFNAPAGMDTVDGVHPNAGGSLKIANNWYTALARLF